MYNAALKLSKDLNINKNEFLKVIEKKVVPKLHTKEEIRHSQKPYQDSDSDNEEVTLQSLMAG